MTWHPIDSTEHPAPRGKPLLGEDGPVIEVMWEKFGHSCPAYFGKGLGDGGQSPMWRSPNGFSMTTPTHWRPLPPPKDEG